MNQQNANNPDTVGKSALDPKSGVLGAHPVGAGVGAVGTGAAVGAAGGAIAGPAGAVAGAAVGAIVGGIAGSITAEAINPTVETKYWRESHSSRPYANATNGYEDFEPAYRYGWESFERNAGQCRTFESAETDLGRGWDKAKGKSRLAWDQAKSATKDAWARVESAARGKSATQ